MADKKIGAGCDNCKKLRDELRIAYENNHRRNIELDALRHVWCDGGCANGVARWSREKITAEHVRAAVDNTLRLVRWWNNRLCKDEYDLLCARVPENSAGLIVNLIHGRADARKMSRKWKAVAKRWRLRALLGWLGPR